MSFNLNKNEESASNAGSSKSSTSKFDLSKGDNPSGVDIEKSNKSKTWLFVLLGVIVLGAGGWYFLTNSSSEKGTENSVVSTSPIDSNTASIPSNDQNKATGPTTVDSTGVNKPENTDASNNTATPNSNSVTKPDNNTNSGSAAAISSASLNNRAPATFVKGSNSISSIDKSLVKDIISFLEKNPNSLITVNGYASSEGELAVNQKISQSRAEAFKRYLISKGIADNRIVSTGKGIDNPIGSNDTEEGRIKNRRVEISIQ